MSTHQDKFVAFYKKYRRLPGYQEIMALTGFKSKNAVFKFISRLTEEGLVRKDARGRLSPTGLLGETPLLGLVEAGIPSTADGLTDTLDVSEYLAGGEGESFFLEVKGDSMIEEGIREGDLVLAVRAEDAKDGEIVIAEVDGGWTMKYLRKKGSRTWLEPANRKYKPIYPEESLRIAAIVRGVVRKY